MEIVAQAEAGDNLAAVLRATRPLALVDFTVPDAALANLQTALAHGVVPIVGTTGFRPEDLDTARVLCREHGTGALIVPNFAIGALLLMQFCAQAARFLPDAEIIEMHHERKVDAPSGTAAKTAEMIARGRGEASPTALPAEAFERLPGARGGTGADGVPIHSVRLPGFVASQMVIFGGPGQTLTLRHDSIDRKSFMPGVLLALRHARELAANGGELVYGLEHLLAL